MENAVRKRAALMFGTTPQKTAVVTAWSKNSAIVYHINIFLLFINVIH